MKHKNLLVVAALTSAVIAPLANAGDVVDNRWYVAPFASFVNTGGDRAAQDGRGGGLGIGKMLNENFNVELKGFYQGFDKKPGVAGAEWQLAGAPADVQYVFSRKAFSPYTVIGLGGMNTTLGAVEEASFIGEAGAGFSYELHENLLVRSDVRYRYNNNFDTKFGRSTDEFHDMVVNVGFVIPLGPKPVAAAKFEMPAPAPVPVPKAADCSTLDDDSDGVNNCLDECFMTMGNVKVDPKGCPISLELKGVNFKVDSAELTPNAKHILDIVAASLIEYPEKDDLEVHGHTSSEGSNAHNLKLSQRRSQSVVDYLKFKGVSNKLTARGFGENQPIAENLTEQGRSMNRRVELIWMGH